MQMQLAAKSVASRPPDLQSGALVSGVKATPPSACGVSCVPAWREHQGSSVLWIISPREQSKKPSGC